MPRRDFGASTPHPPAHSCDGKGVFLKKEHHFLPLVSVVIPTRYRPEMVCRSVLSALRQTHPNLEVIVVVDGPDPLTIAALGALDDPRLRTVPLPENVGGSDARNCGVRTSKGEWIAFLDDDDEWLPQKLEKQLALALEMSTPIPGSGSIRGESPATNGLRSDDAFQRVLALSPRPDRRLGVCSNVDLARFQTARPTMSLHPRSKTESGFGLDASCHGCSWRVLRSRE
jgi:glycosyltransferase involved in cell wall biosynthesis